MVQNSAPAISSFFIRQHGWFDKFRNTTFKLKLCTVTHLRASLHTTVRSEFVVFNRTMGEPIKSQLAALHQLYTQLVAHVPVMDGAWQAGIVEAPEGHNHRVPHHHCDL